MDCVCSLPRGAQRSTGRGWEQREHTPLQLLQCATPLHTTQLKPAGNLEGDSLMRPHVLTCVRRFLRHIVIFVFISLLPHICFFFTAENELID